MNQIDLAMITIQSKPYLDKDELLPVCYRCSTTNPLISVGAQGDACVNCYHSTVRSFASFDHLPLVEFVPEEGISDEMAIELINAHASTGKGSGEEGKSGGDDIGKWQETDHGSGVQTMQLGGDSDGELLGRAS